MVDESRKSGSKVVKWDVGGGKGGSGGRCSRVPCEGGVELCMMGRWEFVEWL